MKTENKMSELKIDAWDDHSAEIAAAASRDAAWEVYIDAWDEHSAEIAAWEIYINAAWEVYIDAIKAFNTAHDSAEKSAKTANDYEAGDYEALDYDPVG